MKKINNIKLSAMIVLSTCLSSLSNSASAVDGQILITQARALAGNVTPGDNAGFPVTINQSGSYRLASNLSGGANGIEIKANDVNIDLNGFTVSAGNLGIFSTQSNRNLTIINGTIRDAQNIGIVTNGYDTQIKDIVITNSGNGILIGGAGKTRAVISNSNISGNKAHGIVISAADCLIESNIISSNKTSGIYISDDDVNTGATGGGCNIVKNIINQNGESGIDIIDYSGNIGTHILDNTINGNLGFGLRVAMSNLGSSVVYGGNVFINNNGGNSNKQVETINPGQKVGIQINSNVCGKNPTCP